MIRHDFHIRTPAVKFEISMSNCCRCKLEKELTEFNDRSRKYKRKDGATTITQKTRTVRAAEV